MGLDIYLHHYTGNRNFADDYQELIENRKVFDEIYKKSVLEVSGKTEDSKNNICTMTSNLTDEQRQEVERISRLRQNHYIEQNNLHLQVGEYGLEINEEDINLDSKLYPDHHFKIGYIRSSYNAGGFNQVVSQKIGYDLYWLFGEDDDFESIVRPKWEDVLDRCDIMLKEMKADPGYSVLRCDLGFGTGSFNPEGVIPESETLEDFKAIMSDFVADEDFCFDGFQMWPKGKKLFAIVYTSQTPVIILKNENEEEPFVWMPKNGKVAREAMEIFKKELASYEENKNENDLIDFSSYTSSTGTFFLNGVEVKGMKYSTGYVGRCMDFITYSEDDFDFYIQGAEIIKEMVEWVLGQDDSSQYYLYWSA